MNRPIIIVPFLILLLGILCFFGATDAQADVCVHQGRQYRDGEEWRVSNSFIMRCFVYHNRWETKVVGCISLTGSRIPVNGQIRDYQGVWKCVQDHTGSTRLVQQTTGK